MCGRFTLTVDPGQLQTAFPWVEVPDQITPRYNIAPTQAVAVIPNDGRNRLDFYIWGLIPSWSKDPQIGNRMINARSETLAEKPSFKTAFRRKRCMILADGFYEWQSQEGSKAKIPMYIKLQTGAPFAFAGLWDIWYSPDGSEIRSCTIITTEPNTLLRKIHNRMPVILQEDTFATWLDPEEKNPHELQQLLVPLPSDLMRAYPVSRAVNNPANDSPDCISPI